MNQRVEMLSTLSATELSPRTLGATNDPSSSTTSSIATIVPHPRNDQEIDPRFLDAFADPTSLPVEFYGALSQITQQPQNQPSPQHRQNSKQSQTSLNSRQSQVYQNLQYIFDRELRSRGPRNMKVGKGVDFPQNFA